MPLASYFLGVGSVLFALILIADAYLPRSSPGEISRTELPIIRIHSEQKRPDLVIFDTTNDPMTARLISTASR